MPIRFRCPDCGETVTVSEHLAGLHTLCSHCKVRILVPSASSTEEHVTAAPSPVAGPAETPSASEKLTTAPPPAELPSLPRYADDTSSPHGFFPPDEYTRPALSGSGEGWGPVRVGLLMLQIGLGMFAGALVVYLLSLAGLCMVGGGMQPQRGFRLGSGTLLVVVGVVVAAGLVLLGTLLFLIGEAVCCAVPGHSGARGMIIGALVCALLGHGLNIVGSIVQISSGVQRQAQPREQFPFEENRAPWDRGAQAGIGLAGGALALLGAILGLISHFLLVGFLQAVARYFGDPALIDRAADYLANLVKFIVAVVVLLALTCMPFIGILAGFGLLGVVVIYGIVLFVKLFNLLAEARRTVMEAMAHG